MTEIYNAHGDLVECLNSKNESTTYYYDSFQMHCLLRIEAPGSTYEFRQDVVNGERIESIVQVNSVGSTSLRTSVFDTHGRLRQTVLPKKTYDRAKYPKINFLPRSMSTPR
ncbi:hypothetical protein [Rickettsiella grylli]|uniref:hypothetical protein n=1 Tax=Rickettsiella grylli TaxID=59196 RepID=UPI00117AA1D6|nr:hypothetical protein [Rickettsiella grylli]